MNEMDELDINSTRHDISKKHRKPSENRPRNDLKWRRKRGLEGTEASMGGTGSAFVRIGLARAGNLSSWQGCAPRKKRGR